MKAPLYDAHNHFHDARLSRHRERIEGELTAIGLRGAVVNGTREADWAAVVEVADLDSRLIPSVGLHPWHVAERSPDWESRLLEHLSSRKCAVGEIGLDRWIKDYDFPAQEEVLLRQIRIAAERNLPMTLHCLQAWGKMLELLQKNPLPKTGFLLHSYGGPAEMIEPFVQLGGYFSFSGYFAHPRKAKQREVFRKIPLERVLLETDAPDMLPPDEWVAFPLPPEDGTPPPNSPSNIQSIYRYFADFYGIDLTDLSNAMQRNFTTLFRPVLA